VTGSSFATRLAVVAMFRLRRNEPDLPRPYRTWGSPRRTCALCGRALALILLGLIFYR
jgi:amino acid transporter